VLKINPDTNRVLVEGVNFVSRHTRPNPGKNIKGGIMKREAPLHASNVQLVCPSAARGPASATSSSRTGGRSARAASARESSTNEPGEGTLSPDVVPALMREFGYTNVMAVPKITKVVVNMGIGEATQNAKIADIARTNSGGSPGSAPSSRAPANRSPVQAAPGDARRRHGHAPGRADVRVPGPADVHRAARVRDFKGVSPKGFDGRGNFTVGLRDQLLFQEIDYMKVDKARGMNVSVCTTAKTDQEARRLLQLIGMPFRTN